MLVKQYDKYMRSFMLTKRRHKKSYENHEKVMEKLKISLFDSNKDEKRFMINHIVLYKTKEKIKLLLYKGQLE